MSTLEERFDKAEEIILKRSFRKNSGFEDSYYIFDYEPSKELYVRERLVKKHAKRPSIEALGFVTAHVQSEVVEKIVPMLSEEEADIYRRGRNIGHTSVPKSSTPTEYRRATGLETLFGWLYLSGKNERIRELFDAAFCDDAFTEKTECED